MLSSEFIIIDNPFGDNTEPVTGVFLLNQKYFLLINVKLFIILKFCFINFSLFINGKRKWARYDMRGKLIDQFDAVNVTNEWEILSIFFSQLHLIQNLDLFREYSFQ